MSKQDRQLRSRARGGKASRGHSVNLTKLWTNAALSGDSVTSCPIAAGAQNNKQPERTARARWPLAKHRRPKTAR